MSSTTGAQVTATWLLVLLISAGYDHRHHVEASIGYFESYGWPSYGIVKPFWMAPFSAHPSRSVSPYSKRHNVLSAGIVQQPLGGLS